MVVLTSLWSGLSHLPRIQPAHLTPQLLAVSVEEDESWGVPEAIDWGQFAPDWFLNVEADEKDLISQFIFELVYDGLHFRTG
jgi:hypothetical protein